MGGDGSGESRAARADDDDVGGLTTSAALACATAFLALRASTSPPAFFTHSSTAAKMALLEIVAPATPSTLRLWAETILPGRVLTATSPTPGVSLWERTLMAVMAVEEKVTWTLTSPPMPVATAV